MCSTPADPLVRDAHESGDLRIELSLEQVLDMVAAIAKIPGDEAHREAILQAALDALHPTTPVKTLA